jgi:hypothetical protein
VEEDLEPRKNPASPETLSEGGMPGRLRASWIVLPFKLVQPAGKNVADTDDLYLTSRLDSSALFKVTESA